MGQNIWLPFYAAGLRFMAAAQQMRTHVDKICHISFAGLHLTVVQETQAYSIMGVTLIPHAPLAQDYIVSHADKV